MSMTVRDVVDHIYVLTDSDLESDIRNEAEGLRWTTLWHQDFRRSTYERTYRIPPG
jgi:hypothetical protein